METILRMGPLYMYCHVRPRIGASNGSKANQLIYKLISGDIFVFTAIVSFFPSNQAIYPEHIEFSEQEKLNICYLAFPDSNSGCMGDTQFHIRLRVKDEIKNTQLNPDLQRFNLQCVTTQRADSSHYWGYVYFRQIKDTTISRGYFQKVIIFNVYVTISRHRSFGGVSEA